MKYYKKNFENSFQEKALSITKIKSEIRISNSLSTIHLIYSKLISQLEITKKKQNRRERNIWKLELPVCFINDKPVKPKKISRPFHIESIFLQFRKRASSVARCPVAARDANGQSRIKSLHGINWNGVRQFPY